MITLLKVISKQINRSEYDKIRKKETINFYKFEICAFCLDNQHSALTFKLNSQQRQPSSNFVQVLKCAQKT